MFRLKSGFTTTAATRTERGGREKPSQSLPSTAMAPLELIMSAVPRCHQLPLSDVSPNEEQMAPSCLAVLKFYERGGSLFTKLAGLSMHPTLKEKDINQLDCAAIIHTMCFSSGEP